MSRNFEIEDVRSSIRRVRENAGHRLNLEDMYFHDLPIEIADLTQLESLDLSLTGVSDLSPIAALTNLRNLNLRASNVSMLAPLADLAELRDLNLQSTQVSDLGPIARLPKLAYLDLRRSHVRDLRPILDMAAMVDPYTNGSVKFEATPACDNPVIASAAEIEDQGRRLEALLAHLRTLPPWPEPLTPPPRLKDDPEPTAPDQDPALPLIWGEAGFTFLPAQVDSDPVTEAATEVLRELIDKLIRKGNAHDDLHRHACKVRDRLEAASLDPVWLHLQYQFLRRLREGADTRSDPFDDETKAALENLSDVVPAITLGSPFVQRLIARQEQDRTATPHGLDPTRERLVLQAVTEPDAPFAGEVKDVAQAAIAPGIQDRLTGARQVLSRNAMIAVIRWAGLSAVSGVIGSSAWAGVVWAVEHQSTLTSLAASLGDDAYWWARRILDRLRVLLEARTPGP